MPSVPESRAGGGGFCQTLTWFSQRGCGTVCVVLWRWGRRRFWKHVGTLVSAGSVLKCSGVPQGVLRRKS